MAESRVMATMLACAVIGVLAAASDATAGVTPPPGRGYELVSMPDKNGGDVIAAPFRIRTAADGSAAVFSSLSATDDAMGTGVAVEYLSQRTGAPGTRGWAAHPITPAQPPMSLQMATSFGVETTYRGDFSPDLSTGVLRAWSPLTDAPNVANVANLYLRNDLRSGGGGIYELISGCPACASPFPAADLINRPIYISASQDFGHVLFESRLALTAGTTAGVTHLYEWSDGTVRLAGVLPAGSPSPSSEGGGGGSVFNLLLGQRAISDDGSKVFFTAPSGEGVIGQGNLYMRVDATTTVLLSRSERTPADVQKPAQFYDATDSGSRVFFTSTQALTGDAPVDGNAKLYVYDTTKPADDPHNLTYLSGTASVPSSSVPGVIGTSADGATVYFIDSTQIVAGEPPLASRGIFVWHDGTISFVAPISAREEPELSRAGSRSRQASVSESGDLVFSTYGPVGPTGYDHGICDNNLGTCREVYLYRLATHSLSCVSCNPSGAPGTSDAAIYAESGLGGSQSNVHETRSITADGGSVYFSSGDALVPGDVNGVRDVYAYDAESGALQLISSGTDPAPSYFMDATPDGHDVFFITREQLVGWDVDHGYDLYDARVAGGFPDPPPAPPICTGDGCQGAPSASLPGVDVGSALLHASDDSRARLKKRHARARKKHCKRGRVRHHGKRRCVKGRRHRRSPNAADHTTSTSRSAR